MYPRRLRRALARIARATTRCWRRRSRTATTPSGSSCTRSCCAVGQRTQGVGGGWALRRLRRLAPGTPNAHAAHSVRRGQPCFDRAATDSVHETVEEVVVEVADQVGAAHRRGRGRGSWQARLRRRRAGARSPPPRARPTRRRRGHVGSAEAGELDGQVRQAAPCCAATRATIGATGSSLRVASSTALASSAAATSYWRAGRLTRRSSAARRYSLAGRPAPGPWRPVSRRNSVVSKPSATSRSRWNPATAGDAQRLGRLVLAHGLTAAGDEAVEGAALRFGQRRDTGDAASSRGHRENSGIQTLSATDLDERAWLV